MHPTPIIAVETTNVFCRPGCPAPSPMPANITHLASAREALFRGFRPCLRCRPLDARGADLTPAELRRAESLRAVLAAARRARRARRGDRAAVLTMLETPLGAMLAAATDEGICLLEFSDRRMLPTQLDILARRLRRPLVAGRHPHLERLACELDAYFAGRSAALSVPIATTGSPFQEQVWDELRRIPLGGTISYEALARRAGRPGAQRAAGTANGANRVALLIPCHRVIRKSGEVGNYGGGRWRKEWLLAHEAAMAAQRRSAFQATSTPTSSYFQATSTAAKPAALSQAR